MDHGHLEKQIKGLVAAIDELAGDKRWNLLLKLIYEKGWTTPAEYKFVSSILSNMTDQVRVMGKLQEDLVAGSKAVLEKNVARK